MLMKNKNIVVEVPENKIKEYEEKGYNKYKKETVCNKPFLFYMH